MAYKERSVRLMHQTEEGRPVDGLPIHGGDIFLTTHKGITTPFPKGASLPDYKLDRWLAENAYQAAIARGDDFNAPYFLRLLEGLKPTKKKDRTPLSQADRDILNLYLWHPQPPVIPKFTM